MMPLVPSLIGLYNLFMMFQQYGLVKLTKASNNYCSASLAFINHDLSHRPWHPQSLHYFPNISIYFILFYLINQQQ